jgi:hypothetical protein
MSLKQNFEWFRNSDSFLIQELIGWVGFRNGFSFFAMEFVDIGKTGLVPSQWDFWHILILGFLTRTRRFMHHLYEIIFIHIEKLMTAPKGI